jgi:UDP-N-acetylmuramoyl-L-alanyl-D-glutamate--2,6-diaminopimelate ligase
MNSLPKQLRVTSHTDHVGPGSTFVAVKGFKEQGSLYILAALEKGASSIVVEEDTELSPEVYQALDRHKVQLVRVLSARKALSSLAAEAYGYPADSLKIIGITGTKGKTTTAFLLEHILKTAEYKTALLGTVKYSILDKDYEAPLTTPQPDFLHAFFALCKEQGVEFVVMEAAAQAFSVHRLDDVRFDAAIFTNFSLEHSEFYKSLEEYFAAKCMIFDRVRPEGIVVLNADDERVARCKPTHGTLEKISLRGKGSYNGMLKASSLEGLQVEIESPRGAYTLSSGALLGEFSAYNLLASVAVCDFYGVDRATLEKALDEFVGVPGRICRYTLPNGAVAVIDNAHTPSSFEAFFVAVRPLSTHIIAVFGAGGDRDRLKRPLMGAVAAHYADQIILTTDNPRSEEVEDITQAILGGISESQLHKVQIEHDREKAIISAYTQSKPGTLLVLLGKGPVEYQHIKDQKIPFSEAQVLRTLRS